MKETGKASFVDELTYDSQSNLSVTEQQKVYPGDAGALGHRGDAGLHGVSIRTLKDIHSATRPAWPVRTAQNRINLEDDEPRTVDLLAALDAEAASEGGNECIALSAILDSEQKERYAGLQDQVVCTLGRQGRRDRCGADGCGGRDEPGVD